MEQHVREVFACAIRNDDPHLSSLGSPASRCVKRRTLARSIVVCRDDDPTHRRR
jgi:hypothetical protein